MCIRDRRWPPTCSGQRLAYVANLPIGLMTGLLGGFYLLWLLLRSRRI